MKRCPKCNRTYTTDTQKFCTHDGGILEVMESPQPDTIRIDSSQLDAPTKAISRELLSEAGKFDPYKTTIGQAPPTTATTEPRARITQDLTPVEPPETTAPFASPDSGTLRSLAPPPVQPPDPPETTAPFASPDSGTLRSLTPPPMHPLPAAQDLLMKTIASAPLPQPAPSQLPPQAQPVKPLPAAPKKKSKVFLILGILAVLLVLGVGVLGAAYIFVVRSRLAQRVTVGPTESPTPRTRTEPTPIAATTPETPSPTPQNEPPPYSPPSDAVQFVNSNRNLDGKLAEHYVDFNFYYPERWEKDPKAGVPGATNFAKMQRQLSPTAPQEILSVSWYETTGSEETDRTSYPLLVEQKSSQLEKNFPEYRKTSQGPTRTGPYSGYEFRFTAMYRNSERGDIKTWGRVIFLPPVDGTKNGVTLLMLDSSLAPEVKSVDDVGVKGELPMILESFRFGKKH
jgi:hypothetical protein